MRFDQMPELDLKIFRRVGRLVGIGSWVGDGSRGRAGPSAEKKEDRQAGWKVGRVGEAGEAERGNEGFAGAGNAAVAALA